jgi:membrane protease YdiL (CAAX protease family)
LLDTLIAVVPILVLTKMAQLDLRSMYARFGRFGRAYVIAIVSFIAVYITIGLLPFHRLLPIHGTMTWPQYLSLSPALLVLVVSNGFQEEFLFRGLFLRRYSAILGVHTASVVLTLVFAFAHAWITYTPVSLQRCCSSSWRSSRWD